MNVIWPWNRCGRYAELISLAAAGVLPDADRPRLDAHLRDCAACRSRLAALGTLASELASVGDWEDRSAPTAVLTARWKSRVRADARQRGRRGAGVAARLPRFDLYESRLTWAALGACWALILGLRWLAPDVSKAPLPFPPVSWAELRIALKRSQVPEQFNVPEPSESGRRRPGPAGAGPSREHTKGGFRG